MKTKTKTAKVKTVKVKTRTMPAGQFKTHCLSVIDEVHNQREEVVITKYGKPSSFLGTTIPTVSLASCRAKASQGKGKIVGDIVSPIFPEDNWDSER
jgi:hypothetical protein